MLFPQDNIQNTYLSGTLIGVTFLNAFIKFYQLQKSEVILVSFLAMILPSCHVLHDGSLQNIPAADLVKGDIILLVSIISCPFLLPTSDHIWAADWRQDPSRSPYLFLNRFESRQQ
jgi:magnesium-transporting ATPase (P-type)